MEAIRCNAVEMLATVTETAGGFFLKAEGMFRVPVGYQFELEWRGRCWAVAVIECLSGACGERQTWLRLRIIDGPSPAKPVKRYGRRRGQW